MPDQSMLFSTTIIASVSLSTSVVIAFIVAIMTLATAVTVLTGLFRKLADSNTRLVESINGLLDTIDPKLSQVTFTDPPQLYDDHVPAVHDDYFEKLKEPPPPPDEWSSLGTTTDGARIFVRPTPAYEEPVPTPDISDDSPDDPPAGSDDLSGVWHAEPPTPTPPPENPSQIDIDTHTLRPPTDSVRKGK